MDLRSDDEDVEDAEAEGGGGEKDVNLRSEMVGGVRTGDGLDLLLVGFWSSQEDDGCLRSPRARDMELDEATEDAGVASGVGNPWAAGMAGTGGAPAAGKKR